MNSGYACQTCTREIASARAHTVTEWATVLCDACADNPDSHAVVYAYCTVECHTVADHPLVVGTRLAAHHWIVRLKRAQEVAGG